MNTEPTPPVIPPVIPPVKKFSSQRNRGKVFLAIVGVFVLLWILFGLLGGGTSSSSAYDNILTEVYPQISTDTGMTIGQARDLSKRFANMRFYSLGEAMGIEANEWDGNTIRLKLMTDYRGVIVNKVLEEIPDSESFKRKD